MKYPHNPRFDCLRCEGRASAPKRAAPDTRLGWCLCTPLVVVYLDVNRNISRFFSRCLGSAVRFSSPAGRTGAGGNDRFRGPLSPSISPSADTCRHGVSSRPELVDFYVAPGKHGICPLSCGRLDDPLSGASRRHSLAHADTSETIARGSCN